MKHARRAAVVPQGFSLVELVIVAAVIALLIVMSLPAIARFIRNYRIRGAMDQVTVEISHARTAAITKNANPGVAFVVADSNSYRWIREVPPPGAPMYGPLRDLPLGVQFATGGATGFRFGNLGTWCKPGTGTGECAPVLPPACQAGEAAQCADAPGAYVTNAATGATIGLIEVRTGVTRQIQVSPGGRIRTSAR